MGVNNQNGVDVQDISNLAIGFPLVGTVSLVKRKGYGRVSVGLGLGLGAGLGVNVLLIGDCRCTIPEIGVRSPVHDTRPIKKSWLFLRQCV